MNIFDNTFTEFESDVDVMDSVTLASKVILYNDEWHTFDEVIGQIIKATGYTIAKAENITNEVHNKGRAIVYSGNIYICLKVSSILEEISLLTEIEL